jgi:3-isopropylmalate/(R)-2-methylmalate dehydratase small subunit
VSREPFSSVTSAVVPMNRADIDTDQIIPARFLKTVNRTGLGDQLFNDWRYLADGSPNPDFVLNRPEMPGRAVLLAGDNFGCGSSREHAPWALMAWGIRAVISSSFADIFRNNSLKNGLLVVEIPPAVSRALAAAIERDPALEVTIDLPGQKVVLPDGAEVPFTIDAFSKHCLLNGVDQLGFLLDQMPAIQRFESGRSAPVDAGA